MKRKRMKQIRNEASKELIRQGMKNAEDEAGKE